MLRVFFVILSCLCCHGFVAAADLLQEVRSQFTYGGTPVHPGIIESFSNQLADPADPQVLAMDLATSQKSNRFDDDSWVKGESGWVGTKRRDPHDETSFGYRFIGSLPSGTMVLQICESGGGSGVFESVALFTIGAEAAVAADGSQRTRHVLRIVRAIPIGDRVHATVRIAGTDIVVDRSKAHDKADRDPLVLGEGQLLGNDGEPARK